VFVSVASSQTAVAVGVEPDNKLPYNEYFEYFGPDYTLHVDPSPMENLNTPKDMERIRNTLLEQLSGLIHAPSVQFQHTPPVNRVLDEVIFQSSISLFDVFSCVLSY
jgi:histone deacetylase 1/2